MKTRRALTIGELARQLDCPIHKVEYLIISRNIKPVQRAGNLRIFPIEVLKLLRDELDRRKEGSCETST